MTKKENFLISTKVRDIYISLIETSSPLCSKSSHTSTKHLHISYVSGTAI